MTNGRLSPIIQHLRRVVRPAQTAGISDAQLLDRFVVQGDAAAFELLLWRHGPMVWGLCRRMLSDFHEAEDAFQASMLVLARKAGTIGKRRSLASWLYKVTFRIVLRAKAVSARRARFEKHVDQLPSIPINLESENGCCELRPLIDEGLNSLPEKYRVPVVLCYLQNKTNEEAARQLHWPVGTVKTRLSKARELLGDWLCRRGVAFSTEGYESILAPAAVSAALPASLLESTLKAAMLVSLGQTGAAVLSARGLLLIKGTLKAMFWTKVKIVTTAALLVSVAGSGVGMISYHTWAADDRAALTAEHSPPLAPRNEPSSLQQKAELKAARSDLEVAATDVKMAEAVLNSAKARLHAAQKNVEEIQKKLPTHQPANSKQPVAFIFDMPITREQLANYLIAQYGADKLEQLVNKLIIERACLEKGITVSDKEVEAAVQEDMKSTELTRPEEFEGTILKKHARSMLQWKEDAIKPRLCMAKLARLLVSVSEEDIRQAFEGAYGEKVECEIILWPKGQEETAKTSFAILGNKPEEFERFAKQQANSSLAARGGKIDPFGRHTTADEIFESAAFRLQPGETSIVETKEGTMAIKCIRRIPPDSSAKLANVHDQLAEQVLAKKAQQEIPRLFEELRKQARPKMLLKN
jgi:RNA polymerase sigma factor (sigma-70 family)